MFLKIEDLTALSELIISDVIKNNGPLLNVKEDYYWTPLDIFNSDSIIGIGSLCDDWSELQRTLQKTHPITNLDIERLGKLFIVLGEELQGNTTLAPNGFTLLIDLHKAQKIAERVFITALKTGIEKVEMSHDQYFMIETDRFDVYKSDVPTTAHSLQSDYRKLQGILNQERAITGEDLILLGGILVALCAELYASDLHILGFKIYDQA